MEFSNYSNLIYQHDPDIAPEPVGEIPWYITIVFVILGTTGNILVCLVVALDKTLQTLANLFLCSLAFTDLLISMLILPARRVMMLTALKPSQFYWCILFVTTDDFLTAASAFHICLISLERYSVIKNPINVTRMSKGRTVKKILAVWFTSLLSVIPVVIIALISDYPSTSSSYCSDILGGLSLFEGILISEALIIVIMIIVVCYLFIRTVTILYQLNRNQRNGNSGMIRSVGGANKTNELRVLNTEMKALKVVWIVSFAFIVAMGPYAAVNLCFLINQRIMIPSVIITLSSYLNYTNSVINPILYTFFNKQFREGIWHILKCRYRKV